MLEIQEIVHMLKDQYRTEDDGILDEINEHSLKEFVDKALSIIVVNPAECKKPPQKPVLILN